MSGVPKPCSLDVEVANELVLSPVGCDAGLIARILLHKVPTPGFHTYNASDAKTVMAGNWCRRKLVPGNWCQYTQTPFPKDAPRCTTPKNPAVNPSAV